MKRLQLIVAAMAVAWCTSASVSEAGPFNHLMRKLGFGWSNGYNAPSNRHWQQSHRGYDVPYQQGAWVPSQTTPLHAVPSPHIVPSAQYVPQEQGRWQPRPAVIPRATPTPASQLPIPGQ